MLRRRIDAPVICSPEELLLSSIVLRRTLLLAALPFRRGPAAAVRRWNREHYSRRGLQVVLPKRVGSLF